MDISLLPIIGDDELETPIYIPNRTLSSTLAANQENINEKKTACSRLNGNANPVPKVRFYTYN